MLVIFIIVKLCRELAVVLNALQVLTCLILKTISAIKIEKSDPDKGTVAHGHEFCFVLLTPRENPASGWIPSASRFPGRRPLMVQPNPGTPPSLPAIGPCLPAAANGCTVLPGPQRLVQSRHATGCGLKDARPLVLQEPIHFLVN